MTDDKSRMLQALFDRVARETDAFEKREADKPFLPSDTRHFKRHEFKQYCLDIERLLGCDSETLGIDSKRQSATLYHANWMFIPTAGLFLDSDDSFLPLTLKDTHRNWQRAALLDRLAEIETAVKAGGTGTMSRPLAGAMGTPIQTELPCIVILYCAGRADAGTGQFYTVTFRTVADDSASNIASLSELADVVRSGSDNSFYALHYAGFPSEGRLKTLSPAATATLDDVRNRLESGTHPLQNAHGRRFLEAVTLHFQRQWGDREAQLLLREHAQSDVAHELCHDLYDSLTLLKHARNALDAKANANEVRSLSAAIESVRSCFATPWLLRLRRKEETHEPIWTDPRPPSASEIAALFAAFERKLWIICNGARPLKRHVKVVRHLSIDGAPIDGAAEPLVIDLGDPPDSVSPTGRGDGLMPPVIWPCGYTNRASIFDREGNRSLLFSPQSELLRNAVRAAERADHLAAALGIIVTLDIASDGSRINGSVRNGLKDGHAMSGADRKLCDKIQLMSHGLKATFAERNGFFEANWELSLK
jgi:hypothetical protein